MTTAAQRILPFASPVLLWLAQPPLALWPFAFIALVPWLLLAASPIDITRRGYLVIWLGATIYWVVTLQGLRHAHPAMYACWIALSAYLAVYPVAFVGLTRRAVVRGISIVIAAPIVWVAQECLRNYLITGISAAMLGHTMADVSVMIQVADIFGSYGVGAVVVCVNVAILLGWMSFRNQVKFVTALSSAAVAASMLIATIVYGFWQLSTPPGEPLATFALLQRDEEVEYAQSSEREVEMFQQYALQSISAVEKSSKKIDVILWPESMYTGAAPWMIAKPDAAVPAEFAEYYPEAASDPSLFLDSIKERQNYFVSRSRQLLSMFSDPPAILAGCGVVEYDESVGVYSGVVLIGEDGNVDDWYGKTHLVMFGEYVPIAPWIPGLKSLVPPGMGLRTGSGAKRMMVGDTGIAPNICIETAVERVTVNQMRFLQANEQMPDVIATVTNDGWFDDSSVIEHHLRCAQLVAVSIRRPILSAANNGPTASIDSNGQIIARLPTGSNDTLITTPTKDARNSIYLKLGAIPAWLCVALTALLASRKLTTDY